jgi:hypothetical protein
MRLRTPKRDVASTATLGTAAERQRGTFASAFNA